MHLRERDVGELARALDVRTAAAIARGPARVQDLTPAEAARYRELVATPRSDSWLRGRAALKRLLRRLGMEPDTSTVKFPHPRFSLTHSGRYALAVAADGSGLTGVGIDLELNAMPRQAAARFFVTAEEQEQCAYASVPTAYLLRLWTVKEALFKADPHNQGRGLLDYVVRDIATRVGWARAHANGSLGMRYASLDLGNGFLSLAVSYREGTA